MTKLKTKLSLALLLGGFLFASLLFTGCNSESESAKTEESTKMDDADTKPIKTGAKGTDSTSTEPVKMDSADTKPIKTGP